MKKDFEVIQIPVFNTIPLAYYELSRLERYLHFFGCKYKK